MPKPQVQDSCSAPHFDPWDSDHTSLVHVLWNASGEGHDLTKADDLASFIMRSHWFEAVKAHAKDDVATPVVEPADVTTKPADPLSSAEEA